MSVIRKFVGCVKVVAGTGAVLVLALSSQTASAHWVATTESAPGAVSHTSQVTLTPECTAAIQSLKAFFANDRAEDAIERQDQLANPDPAADRAEDATEVAAFKAQFAAVRSACGTVIAALKGNAESNALKSPACATALQALNAAVRAVWAQHTRPTDAQIAQLKSLSEAARAACGWSTWSGWSDRSGWSGSTSWSGRR